MNRQPCGKKASHSNLWRQDGRQLFLVLAVATFHFTSVGVGVVGLPCPPSGLALRPTLNRQWRHAAKQLGPNPSGRSRSKLKFGSQPEGRILQKRWHILQQDEGNLDGTDQSHSGVAVQVMLCATSSLRCGAHAEKARGRFYGLASPSLSPCSLKVLVALSVGQHCGSFGPCVTIFTVIVPAAILTASILTRSPNETLATC